MKTTILAQGAEAKIFLDKKGKIIIKDRIKKNYRISFLDEKIRKLRTRSETKLLEKASQIINCPKPIQSDKFDKIKIPFIDGKKLSDCLDNFPLIKQKRIMNQLGKDVAKLHDKSIIHGDLTTSNMILSYKNPNNSEAIKDSVHRIKKESSDKEKLDYLYFIDFGLGFISPKIEDKAVDIHLLKQALEAKHFKHWEILFQEFLKGYKTSIESDKIINQMIKVEKRGRYRGS